ncbi:MAG TPA: ABC-F family ATP-binding cassette domain-containing protein [Microlunatus sp.]
MPSFVPTPVTSLVLTSLSFRWPNGEPVFGGLDAAFGPGRTGLVGRNGAGKSTLLRLLARDLEPTGGSVTGPEHIGYLPQNLVLEGHRSVAGVLGIEAPRAALARITAGSGVTADFELIGDRWDLEERITAALAQFGFEDTELDRRIDSLSGGEVVLLALAGLLLAEPDVLILDEPTNNLDRGARGRLYQALRGWRGPAILVSHDRELLDLVEEIAELRDGELRFFGGNFTAFTEALAVQQEAAARSVRVAKGDLRRQQRELAEMRIKLDRRQRYARSQAENVPKIVAGAKKRAAQVSAGKARGGHEADVAEARHHLASAEERVRDDALIRIDLSATTVPAGRDVLVVDGLRLRNQGDGSGLISLHLRGPERVGVVGANGSGKTTLINTLLGRVPAEEGTVSLRVPTRLLPQRLQLLEEDDTVLQAVSRHARHVDDNALRAELARFLLDADTVSRPVRTLSGGERFRATLAALLLGDPPPQLLILDEPTNSLDLDSVAQLTAALLAYRGALLVASHDRPFLGEIGLTGELDLDRGDGLRVR